MASDATYLVRAAPSRARSAARTVRLRTLRTTLVVFAVLSLCASRSFAQSTPATPPAPEQAVPTIAAAPPPLAAPSAQPGDESNPIHVKLAEEKRPEPLTRQLIKYGVSVGVAAAVIMPAGTGKAEQTSTGVAAMPYVVLVPAYMWMQAPRREYCAARALGISRTTARAATNTYAHALAAEAFSEQRASGLGPYMLTEEARNAPTFNQLSSGEQEGLISTYTGWNVGEAEKGCHTWWGIYAGIPLGYEANFGDAHEARSVRTRGSLGLALLPLSFLHVLIGMTSIAAKQEAPTASYQPAWQFTLAIGGSIDVFAPLLKGLGY